MTESPVTVSPSLSIADARERMFLEGGRHLPVVEDGKLVGIITARDCAVLEASLEYMKDDTITVRVAMSSTPYTCHPDARLHTVASEMAEQRYGSAVVVDPDAPSRIVGLFTTTDAMRALVYYTEPYLTEVSD